MNKLKLVEKIKILKFAVREILPKNIAVKTNGKKLIIYERRQKSFNIRIDKTFKEDFNMQNEIDIIKDKINYIML